jgi:hypothetical protein
MSETWLPAYYSHGETEDLKRRERFKSSFAFTQRNATAILEPIKGSSILSEPCHW